MDAKNGAGGDELPVTLFQEPAENLQVSCRNDVDVELALLRPPKRIT
jgi:hypothetical protein